MHQVELVEVRLAQTALPDTDKLLLLQLLQVRSHASVGHAHVLRKPSLPREAIIILPSVLEKHGVSELRSRRQDGALENMIRDLGESSSRQEIGSPQNDVSFYQLRNRRQCTLLRLHTGILPLAAPITAGVGITGRSCVKYAL